MLTRPLRMAALGSTAIAVTLLLSGCFLTGPAAAPPTVTVTAPPATTPPTTPPTDAATDTPTDEPTDTATDTPVAKGCAPTSASKPSDAAARKVLDVDGDGRKDTEWISLNPSLRFGVTTASGATYSYSLSSASPQPRAGFITRLNDHRIVSIVGDGRAAYVHFFVNCGWVTPKDSHGAAYTFDIANLTGNGTGIGCSGGFVVQWNAINGSTGYTVKKTEMYLNTTGSFASKGPTSTVVQNASVNDSRVKLAQSVSCGSATVSNSGVTVG